MTRVQQVGEFLRFEGRLDRDLFELTILTVARHWNQQFEWGHHQPIALKAGVPESVIEDIAAGRRPRSGRQELADVWEMTRELLSTGKVSDETFAHVRPLGDETLVELTTTIGYYTTLALIMNVDQSPAPADAPRLIPEVL
ncbi:carboxymuconolactone decarboxylase family protein [Microbacterium sp.]|uniref:carboxymuconolactone decarboxylase family protein n=1 Tax=Microbacterium sp. TaxID=51671 RepID=UPI003A9116E9